MSEAIKQSNKVTMEVTPEENRMAWKKMKDKTSSASHAPNLSLYKVTSTDDTTNRIDAMIRSIPFTMGFRPKSWCHADDVMILKISGVHNIDGMRCIQLFDAEFNIASKKMAKEVMQKAEENSPQEAVNLEGQSQSRPNIQIAGHVPSKLETFALTTILPYCQENRPFVLILEEVYSINSRLVRQSVEPET